VQLWAPPRGPRDEFTGRWLWSLAQRPLERTDSGVERQAVTAQRRLVGGLSRERRRQGLSLRALATLAGVSLTALTSLESGSSWSRLSTVEAVAAGLQQVLSFRGRRDLIPALLELAHEYELPSRALAQEAFLRANTLSELHLGRTTPSMATVLAIAAALGIATEVEVTARSWFIKEG